MPKLILRASTVAADDTIPAERLAELDDCRSYAVRLWEVLEEVRAYLLYSLPSDPERPDEPLHLARPDGPDDDEGWSAWARTYAATTSALAGPHGDNGLGVAEAMQTAEKRRGSPTLSLLHRRQRGAVQPRAIGAARSRLSAMVLAALLLRALFHRRPKR